MEYDVDLLVRVVTGIGVISEGNERESKLERVAIDSLTITYYTILLLVLIIIHTNVHHTHNQHVLISNQISFQNSS